MLLRLVTVVTVISISAAAKASDTYKAPRDMITGVATNIDEREKVIERIYSNQTENMNVTEKEKALPELIYFGWNGLYYYSGLYKQSISGQILKYVSLIPDSQLEISLANNEWTIDNGCSLNPAKTSHVPRSGWMRYGKLDPDLEVYDMTQNYTEEFYNPPASVMLNTSLWHGASAGNYSLMHYRHNSYPVYKMFDTYLYVMSYDGHEGNFWVRGN